MKPVTVLFGSDSYTKQLRENDTRKRLSEIPGGCETFIFDGECDDNAADAVHEIQSGSLFSAEKLVIIRNAEKMLDKELKKFLVEYSKKNDPPAIVIVETAKKAAWFKDIPSIKIDVPYEDSLPRWIINEASSRGKRIEPDAAGLLVFYCGRNLSALAGEIEKLCTAFPDRTVYTAADVKSVAVPHRKDDIFGYIDALIDGQEKKALLILENMLEYNTEPIYIVATLKWKLQQMLTVRMLLDKGVNERDVIDRAGFMPKFIYSSFCGRVKKYSLARLVGIYGRLQELDVSMKSSAASRELLLEEFSLSFSGR